MKLRAGVRKASDTDKVNLEPAFSGNSKTIHQGANPVQSIQVLE